MSTKIFVAEKSGQCGLCKQELLGKRILYDDKTRQFVHADCKFPDKAGNGRQSQVRPEQAQLPPLPPPLDIAQLEGLVQQAKAMTAQALNIKTDEILPDNALLPIVLQGLLQKQSQEFSVSLSSRIEIQDERKMKAYGKGA